MVCMFCKKKKNNNTHFTNCWFRYSPIILFENIWKTFTFQQFHCHFATFITKQSVSTLQFCVLWFLDNSDIYKSTENSSKGSFTDLFIQCYICWKNLPLVSYNSSAWVHINSTNQKRLWAKGNAIPFVISYRINTIMLRYHSPNLRLSGQKLFLSQKNLSSKSQKTISKVYFFSCDQGQENYVQERSVWIKV